MTHLTRVLMLEDLRTDADLIEREVRRAMPESEFLCVETRADFVEALTAFAPDIILSDYKLPHFDGLAALRLATTHAPDVPFIIITGSMNEDTAVDCMKAGAWDYVIKEHLKRVGPAVLSSLEQKELRIERRLAVEALRESEQRYRSLFEVAPVGIVVHGERGIVFANPAGLRLLGASSMDQLVGRHFAQMIHPDSLEHASSRIQRLLAGERGLYPTEDVFIKLDGTPFHAEIMATLLTYQKQPAVQVIMTDITARKRAEEDFRYLSYHDYLTDLHNRRFFEAELRRVDAEGDLPITLIMGDVNGLKLINDSFGHEAGDELLKKAAGIIRAGCRPDDVVARIGGDEFAIILPRADESEAQRIVEGIQERAADVALEHALLSISLGYATKHDQHEKMQDVMAAAENFMYKRKMYESASMRHRAIDVIMSALFEKSQRELLHSRRVSAISAAIASELGFGQAEVNKIRISGLVHDIGKIAVDETILNKPGRLSHDEWVEIRKHPEAGWRILSSVNEFLDLAKHVLSHHERWDGKGYPGGLQGEAIPIESRIIAVADAYDAMTSRRSYSDPSSKEEAVLELRKCSGLQFDPQIVDVFLQVLENNSDLNGSYLASK